MKDQKIIEAYNTIAPERESRERVLKQIREKEETVSAGKGRKIAWLPRTAVAAILVVFVLAGTVTAYAMWRFLSPSEVAEEMEDQQLADAFRSEKAIQTEERQQFGEYYVTLLGLMSGKNLTEHKMKVNGKIHDDRTYCVVAIGKVDGSAISEGSGSEDGESMSGDIPEFLASPFIQGHNPRMVNIFWMGGGRTGGIEKGVLYYIVDCDNLSAFADKKIYLSVSEGQFVPAAKTLRSKESLGDSGVGEEDAYIYYKDTGEIERNPNYKGVNALFTLPMDESLADPDKADKLLKKWKKGADEEDKEPAAKTAEEKRYEKIGKYMRKICNSCQKEKIEEKFTLIKDCVQTKRVDKKGNFHFQWEKDPYGGVEFTGARKYIFNSPDQRKPGAVANSGYSTDGKYVTINLYEWNKDGSVTMLPYYKKVSEILAEVK